MSTRQCGDTYIIFTLDPLLGSVVTSSSREHVARGRHMHRESVCREPPPSSNPRTALLETTDLPLVSTLAPTRCPPTAPRPQHPFAAAVTAALPWLPY